MNLPDPPSNYSRVDQVNTRASLKAADDKNLKRSQDITLERVIRTSPDGTEWVLGVSNAGVTTWTLA